LKIIIVVIGLIISFFIFPNSPIDHPKNSFVDNEQNLRILSKTEMEAIVGGCGSGGICKLTRPTDCGTCTAYSVGVCNVGIGSCTANQLYIKCICGPNVLVWAFGCL
jgi:hypothetical protein